MKIVIDTLGSDNKLDEILDGVVTSAKTQDKFDYALVGPKDYITNYLNGKMDFKRLELIDASVEVDDYTNPFKMLRDLDDTALVKALKRTNNSDAIGLLTQSSTGCVIVGSIMHIGLVSKELLTPILVCLIKDVNLKDICLSDCGANINSTSENLLNYAKYANAFVKSFFNIDSPRVALLSNGSSDSKGDNVIKGANKLLKESNLNFVGNIEANNIFTSNIDILVCDGMLGNVVLKNSEGVARTIMNMTNDNNLKENILNHYGYSDLGSSFLLGTKKIVCKMHGNVSSLTIKTVVEKLIKLYDNDFISKIENI